MNTSQLLKCISQDPLLSQCCAGVFPVDRIPPLSGIPECFILNLDPHYKPGSHWVAIYVDHDRNVEFFDSYGRKPCNPKILKFLKNRQWECNEKQLQSPYSSACGQHCLYFLCHRVKGNSMQSIVGEKFGTDLEQNDITVTSWVNENFDVHTNVVELDFMLNQICCALLCT